jgi:hypothetical protein
LQPVFKNQGSQLAADKEGRRNRMADEKKPSRGKGIFRLERTGVNETGQAPLTVEPRKKTARDLTTQKVDDELGKSEDVSAFALKMPATGEPQNAFSLAKFEGDEDAILFEQSQNNPAASNPSQAGKRKNSKDQNRDSTRNERTGAKIHQLAAPIDRDDSLPLALPAPGRGSESQAGQPNSTPLPKKILVAKSGTGKGIWPDSSRQNSRNASRTSNTAAKSSAGKLSGLPSEYSVTYQLAQSDPYIARRRLFLLLFLASLMGGAAYALIKYPELLKALKTSYEKYVSAPAPMPSIQDDHVGAVAEKADLTFTPELRAAIASGDCGGIIQAGLREVGNDRLATAARVRIIDCFLAGGNYGDAEMMLRPIRSRLAKMSERAINQEALDAGIGESFILSAIAYMKVARFSDATKMVNGRCQTWALTSVCLAKLLVDVKLGNANSAAVGFEAMSIDIGRANPTTRAVMHYIGAQIAVAKNVSVIADDEHGIALKNAPKSNAMLIHEIYNSWSLDLYKRKDLAGLGRLTGKLQQEAAAIDGSLGWKLLMYREFIDSQKGPDAMKKFLNRPDFSAHARRDYEFLITIGPEALAWNQAKRFSELTNDARTDLQGKYSADTTALSKLSVWRLRALLGQYSL